jgi:hypothetical protein
VSSQTNYPYASGDLLEHRNTYFYSEYQGGRFLEAWRQQRTDALRDTSPETTVRTLEAAGSPALTATDLLLQTIYQHMRAEGNVREHMSALDRFVQRFEVSKRLHGGYDEGWRPVDPADYRVMERYVRFAEILDLAHGRMGGLTYLNALLKVVDTLTALQETLTTQQRARLRRVIAHERDHVGRLAARLAEKTSAP